ncbi:MAG: GNAT family N-acetyltransferase [Oscillospiraceae bacterium]|nr:GNAT family N-acetyltransferase [Oscillospiraceae bacterium]
MKFCLAKKSDLPQLTKLWQECFGDDPKEIQGFWSAVFDRIRVYTATEGPKTVAMACVIPTQFVDEEGESHSCGYVYAVCTAAPFRGRGICKGLLDYIHQNCGFAYTALVPAQESLFSYYKALGYSTCFFHREYTVLPKKGGSVKIASPEVYRSIRELQLYDNFLSYDEYLLPCAGQLYRIETEDGLYCACGYKKEQTLYIRELLPNDPAAAATLCAHLGCAKAEVRTMGEDKPFGMMKALKNRPIPDTAYLGLALD